MKAKTTTIRLGELFHQRREQGARGLPVLSVTLSEGVVRRDAQKKKITSNLSPEEHLRVYPGDIAYNTMRMWQGASGLCKEDGMISPAYIVCMPTDRIDPGYASHLFQTRRMIERFRAYSQGITDFRRRLYFDSFRAVPATIISSIDVQRLVAKVFDQFDTNIAGITSLITTLRCRRSGLMTELLTGRSRFPEFSKPWVMHRLGDLLVEEERSAIEMSDDQEYPLVSVRRRSGGLFRRESKFGKDIKTKNLRPVRSGDFLISKMQVVRGALSIVPQSFDGMFVSGSYLILHPSCKETLDVRFLDLASRLPSFYHKILRSCCGVHIEKMTFYLNFFMKESIAIPPTLAEQHKIIQVLTAADREIKLLEQLRDTIEIQKRGLMQRLLAGEMQQSDSLMEKLDANADTKESTPSNGEPA